MLRGVYTAIITPFTESGEVDFEGLSHNLQYQLQKGIDGIVVLGTTGETPTLTEKEKEAIIRFAVKEVKGKTHLMVGTGSYSTRQTIENTAKAKDLGADSALIVTPYYNKPTQEGLYLHFKAVTAACNLPICIYNIQGRTGQNILTDTLKKISDLPGIIGVKEASGNIAQMSDVIETIGRKRSQFSVLSGDDALTLPLISLGGHGVISVVSNLIPGPIIQMTHAALKGDFCKARELYYQLMPTFKAAFIETNPIPIKAAMQMRKMPAGPCRLPLCNLLPENDLKLQQVIHSQPPQWI